MFARTAAGGLKPCRCPKLSGAHGVSKIGPRIKPNCNVRRGAMRRPKPIEWPNKAKICVTFIVPWEVWPENFATRESLQQSSHRAPPANAVFQNNMAAVTHREYG